MKIKLPEHNGDITLLQYQKYYELLQREGLDEFQINQRKVQIFTGIKPNEFNLITQKDIEEMLKQIDLALESTIEFVSTFKVDNVEFGFIPNFDKITGAEYFDLSKYGNDVETLHNLMAILFRPIKNKDVFGNYSITNYNGTSERAEIMKLTPMNAVNGALFFFVNLRKELLSYTLRYMEEEQARENKRQTISKSGDGMQPLMN
jgi:hypothetical protein